MLEYLLEKKRKYKSRIRKFNYYDFYKKQLETVREIKLSRENKSSAA